MRKYLRYLGIFTLPVFIVGLYIEMLSRNIPNDYSYKRKYLDAHSKSIEVLILGASTTYFGINPILIKANCFNAAHVAQSLNFDLKILKRYKDKWDNLKFIVIPIDYISLYFRLEKSHEAARVKNYEIYYDIKTAANFSLNLELLNDHFNPPLRLYNYYLEKRSDITCSELGWGPKYQTNNTGTDLISSGEKSAKRHTSFFSNENFQQNSAVLKEMVEFTKARKIKIFFFTPPAYKSYVENLNINQMNTTVDYITQLANSNFNTKYFNLINDKSFEAGDFCDANHLNDIGARKLSLRIDSLLMTM